MHFSEEISRQLLDCSAKAIITLTDLWPLAKATTKMLKKDVPILTINSVVSITFSNNNFIEIKLLTFSVNNL